MFARRRAAVGSICDIGTALIRSKKREPRRAFDLTRPREPWGVWQGTSREGEAGLAAKDFRACREPDARSACSQCGEERAIWLELAAIARAMASGFSVLALEVEL